MGVEVLLVGLADDACLAMGASSGVWQDELENTNRESGVSEDAQSESCAFISMHLLFPIDYCCFAGFCFVQLSDGRFGNKVVSHFNDCAPASAASDLYLGSVFLKLENFCIPAPTSEPSSAVCKMLSQQQIKRTNKYQRLSFSKINLMCEDEGNKKK